MTEKSPATGYILDANVLIDYVDSDRFVLELLVKHVAQIVVATPVLEEVGSINSPEELHKIGIHLVEPELDELVKAGEGTGALSFQDRLCLLLADRLKLTCVTNDKQLRKACAAQRIETLWGLEPLVLLVKRKKMTPDAAWRIANGVQQINPRHITQDILRRFRARIQLVKET